MFWMVSFRLEGRVTRARCEEFWGFMQADYPGAAVNSGVIACKPNHPVWDKAFEIMHERRGELVPCCVIK